MDRSYRGQPHWLFPDDNPPKFRTLIIDSPVYMVYDHKKLSDYNVYCVPRETIYRYSGKHSVHKNINNTLR